MPDPAPPPPSALFGPLFARVQGKGLFPDSKTFADAIPRSDPASVLRAYEQAHPRSTEALRAFVAAHFDLPADEAAAPAPAPGAGVAARIAELWPVLTRPPSRPASWSSELALEHPFVVAGGRFREAYYWDSYFTLLGLIADGEARLAQAMVDNFAELIGRHGHIPNGARSYFLTRSQPPVFHLMAGLVGDSPAAGHARYLGALEAEHRFWMDGADRLAPGEAYRRVAAMPDGTVLNRYWDDACTPRDESWREDVALAAASKRPSEELWRDLRAAAESGWDFSSRWLADPQDLASIETTSIVPVDLNALLWGLERAIAAGAELAGDPARGQRFRRLAEARRIAVDRWLWRLTDGCYGDFDWRRGAPTGRLSAATLAPLFAGMAARRQAAAVAATIARRLLRPGGLATTEVASGQQWDAPNGWAPLQYIAVIGLERTGHAALARDIAGRWLALVETVFATTGKLMEKYDLEEAGPGGGGEYPAQDGFGWTNGVTRALQERLSPSGARIEEARE